MKKLMIGFMLLNTAVMSIAQDNDPYIWLEEVESPKALAFAEEQSTKTLNVLMANPEYQKIYDNILKVVNSKDRIIYPNLNGAFMYNFWQDEKNPRGIWRRCTKESYESKSPVWETLLDLDVLSEKDGIKWVYKGASGLYPKYDRFLLRLSRGGGDAVVIKEFDVNTKTFIEGGFQLAEAKGSAGYLDVDHVIVSSDFGPGTMTSSGYANQVKLWKRGTDISTAQLIHEGNVEDVSSFGYVMRDGDVKYLIIGRSPTFYTTEEYVFDNGKKIKLDLPDDSQISGLLHNELIVLLKSEWEVMGQKYPQGSLISLDFKKLIKNEKLIKTIFTPDETASIDGISTTKNKLLLNVLRNVKGELHIFSIEGGKWLGKKVEAPNFGTISLADADEFSDQYYASFTDFLTPTTLYKGDAEKNTFAVHQSLPAFFDGSKYKIDQSYVKSTDGTMVPYFIISKNGIVLDGKNPTLLYAYGGFEVSMTPSYSASTGLNWLENGGTYVLANIRGGGEFGPKWHQAGLKEKRQIVYDDFHAVAEDLIKKKITSPAHLGIMGGSNGGLLMGVAFTQRPELYNAVVCQVPLLDMKRYNKLLAGASWMGEYGNPDLPEEWAFISKYSPYQNLKSGAKYPEVYFDTSTRDDRVHPGHARKMVAKMMDMGYKVYYYENTEGGHGGSSTNEQRAKWGALEYSYLLMKLK
ncbi:MAG TPA: prolyl oligopeptidase family serine peptidase [Saprospiraceae bacterium]|nr:prolyl oligopeptidase family serine peptidase [Saprospiraceae bacterium]